MRLTIDHRTVYAFTAPQGRIVQLLRMTPGETHDQTVADWHIAVDCDARMTRHRDGFGNATTMLYCEGAIERIELTVSGEVVTSSSSGVLHGAAELLPPRFFLRTTPTTAADPALAAFAEEEGGGRDIAALHRLNGAVRARFADDCGRPVYGRTAAEAFALKALTPRDMAQVFIAAARAVGAPARYVSGYCDLAGDHRPTPHGWAEAYVADLGWIAFDPWLGLSPEEHHVRVAIALDAAGAAPVAGSRLGEGVERLEVDVTVQSDD
ncbi:transglutaminase family protein [Sphingomonas sp. IC4-52]|uniref:transglutaminase family protein n=1 Tax=Sphingomonas sp. IC4-52 TaxID=2887202 RepID=UPI001D128978|nr:transglutaminase N-terminal domain-containing protein [Sphingomonas sp. IC4-52]MCC2980195.1 transglutaminase family protein [Sphingomonas sp. IC4-52]